MKSHPLPGMQGSIRVGPSGGTVTEPPNKPPPPLPKKQPSYVNITKAHPVGEWLKSINLPQYQDNFLKNGFDVLMNLKSMSKRDLMEIGISNVIHIDMMLESLKRISQ